MKKFLLLLPALAIIIAGCAAQTPAGKGNQNQNQNANQVDSLTPEQRSAREKCLALAGEPRLADSMLHAQTEIFCSFSQEGECTQGELNEGGCFKQVK